MQNLVSQREYDASTLLAMRADEASAIFQALETKQQIKIIETAGDAKKMEEMIYLLPDGSNIIPEISPIRIAMIVEPQLDTNPIGILPYVSAEQFLFFADSIWWASDDQLNEKEAYRWLLGLAECQMDVVKRVMPEVLDTIVLLVHNDFNFHFDFSEEGEEEEIEMEERKANQKVRTRMAKELGFFHLDDINFEDDRTARVFELLAENDLLYDLVKKVSSVANASGWEKWRLRLVAERNDRQGVDAETTAPIIDDFLLLEEEEIEI